MKQAVESTELFKECSMCGTQWATRDAFLRDAGVVMLGYQADFVEPGEGCFLFNHTCGTTVAEQVKVFFDLYDGEHYEESKAGSRDCPGHCTVVSEMEECELPCRFSYVRKILNTVNNWPKDSAVPSED